MTIDWQPTATRKILKLRANVLRQIRKFMSIRDILEVETPVLNFTTSTDPSIESFTTQWHDPASAKNQTLYLHTSPECAMKRLLASGSGPIYQIIRVFRDYEAGRIHSPEFTMLEWYRPGFDHNTLMNEVDELIKLFGFNNSIRISYCEVFEQHTGIDPHYASLGALAKLATDLGLHSFQDDRSHLLDFIFSKQITPKLADDNPFFIYDYPACQCALAMIREGNPPVAERFELFISGIEIANGFNELCDAEEQRMRFDQDKVYRHQHGKANYEIDQSFLAALQNGLPACAGVALGLDRLLMVMTGCSEINDVLSFPFK